MKNTFIGLLVIVLSFILSNAYAHRDGCHRWHSCPSDSGSYVCGDLGYTTYCPNKSVPQTVAPTSVPERSYSSTVVTTDTYTVQAGDTLGEIASNYSLTVAELARTNNITNYNSIYVGQVLGIPSNAVPYLDLTTP